jgi:threonine/homoserine/homoserine lactone efflux protein
MPDTQSLLVFITAGLLLEITMLGLIFIINGTVVCLVYAIAASSLADRLKTRYDITTWLNRAMGGLFVALGLRLALEGRR